MALSRVPGDDELYVGGIFTLRRRGALEAVGITHIVSVLRYDFKDFQDWEKYKHCAVDVDDVEDENLLGEFNRTNAFIDDALKSGGKVLVHCAMGKSRSVTVTLAYLLSTRPNLTLESALELVRESRPIAEPNDGFMSQLALYVSMKYPTDIDAHPAYQRWLYQRDVELSVATGRAPDNLRFEDEVAKLSLSTTSDPTTPTTPMTIKELRCKRCRRALATSDYVIPHTPKASPSSKTDKYAPISSLPSQQPTPNPTAAPSTLPKECTHHFIHPLSWMRPELEQSKLEGRLECPNGKCKQLVGRYAWQGMRCSCGEWIVPGFSLQGARVDEIVKRGGAGVESGSGSGTVGGGGIRLPPGMKSLGEKGNL